MQSLRKSLTLVGGIVLGILLTLGVLKVAHHVQRTGALLPPALIPAADANAGADASSGAKGKKAGNELELAKLSFRPTARLGQVTFAYTITASNKSADAGMQLYVRDQNIAGPDAWRSLSPTDSTGAALILHLYHDIDSTGTFVVALPKGDYREFRLFLFASPDGKNVDFNHTLYDSVNDKTRHEFALNLNVISNDAPILGPQLSVAEVPAVATQGNGDYTVTIPAKVKVPSDYQAEEGGFWAMAKSSAGFSQVWAAMKDAVPGGDPSDPHKEIPVVFTLKDVKPGLWNAQFGLFKYSWGSPLNWVYPGMDFEAGGDTWVQKAPEDRIPPRLMVANDQFETLNGRPYAFYRDGASRRAAAFVRGGNYGNAISWSDQPALDTPGYFTLLGDMGCKYVRLNFNPDRYPDQPVYQHAVDQVVQNIWAAGLYPILAPQDLPKGATPTDQANKGVRVMRALAEKYKDRSVWIEVCNEPHEFGSWAAWKPIAEKYVKTVRAVDPNAFVIVPFENYSKDGRGAAKDPITSVHVDLYDGHAYVTPEQVATLFGTAAKAGLPVLIGEYGSNDEGYLRRMDKAFQDLPPGVLGVSPWAFTVKGQDSLPLIEDGSTATLRYTSAGQAVADDFAKWNAGKKVE